MSIYLETFCWKEFLPKFNSRERMEGGGGEGGGDFYNFHLWKFLFQLLFTFLVFFSALKVVQVCPSEYTSYFGPS